MHDENNGLSRRDVLRTGSGVVAVGIAGVGITTARNGRGANDRGGPPEDPGARTIEWDERRGSENVSKDCPGGEACWKWILTPGGQPSVAGVGDLRVTFKDEETVTAPPDQRGEGAFQFEICRMGGGTVDSAAVDVESGGPNSQLTISEVDCTSVADPDVAYWQLDFGEGSDTPGPDYGTSDQDLVMAALGGSDGATWNPSFTQNRVYVDVNDTIDVDEWDFDFDDENQPTTATVHFTIPENVSDGPDLHLAAFERPMQEFDEDPEGEPPSSSEIDLQAQELSEISSGSFSPGESATLTVTLPT